MLEIHGHILNWKANDRKTCIEVNSEFIEFFITMME